MKTYAIGWKSKTTGTVGTGTKRFEKEEAVLLARELNEAYPDINHEAIVPSVSAVPTGAEMPAVQAGFETPA